jgi:hypothetical protein
LVIDSEEGEGGCSDLRAFEHELVVVGEILDVVFEVVPALVDLGGVEVEDVFLGECWKLQLALVFVLDDGGELGVEGLEILSRG